MRVVVLAVMPSVAEVAEHIVGGQRGSHFRLLSHRTV